MKSKKDIEALMIGQKRLLEETKMFKLKKISKEELSCHYKLLNDVMKRNFGDVIFNELVDKTNCTSNAENLDCFYTVCIEKLKES